MIKLTQQAKELLSKSLDEKIEYVSQEKWLSYPSAKEILNKLEDIFLYEKGKNRVTSILLVGSPNNGKTSLLVKFMEAHPDYDLFATNPEKLTEKFFEEYTATGSPIKYILSPNEPSETRLYSNILHSLNAPFKDTDNTSKKQYLVEYYLKLLNVNMLIIDEIQCILSGSVAKQKQVLSAIKNLSNSTKIPIVLAGTKEALRVIATDTAISSRYRPIYLKKWKMDQEYINLLATILTTLPLEEDSDILNHKVAEEILNISEGYIGDIVGVIREATVFALRNNRKKITLQDIKTCGYISEANLNKSTISQDI